MAARGKTSDWGRREERKALLDHALARLRGAGSDVYAGMEELLRLDEVRASLPRREWLAFAKQECVSHPIREVLHHDPLTARSFEKPRGYPGDAVLLDLLYDHKAGRGAANDLGHAIYQFNFGRPTPKSVRARRDYLATKIDEVADRFREPCIMSLACGHLREAKLARAVVERRVKSFLAIDNDPASLAVVETDFCSYNVSPIAGSVRAILSNKLRVIDTHLIYCAGLYDYLTSPIAKRLTSQLLTMLAPGGSLLIANFAPNPQGAGYTESFMDWWLIHRDEAAMTELLQGVDSGGIMSFDTYRDALKNIVYLEVVRA